MLAVIIDINKIPRSLLTNPLPWHSAMALPLKFDPRSLTIHSYV